MSEGWDQRLGTLCHHADGHGDEDHAHEPSHHRHAAHAERFGDALRLRKEQTGEGGEDQDDDGDRGVISQ